MANKKVLLVEDNPDDEALTLRALKRHNLGNSVDVVRDGAEALDYLFPGGDTLAAEDIPAVVMLDLMLPKVNGLDVLKRIREEETTKLLPVVVLTSSDEQKDMIDSYKLGANSYVRKPVEFGEFADAVSQLGLYWILYNEPPPAH